MPKDSRENRMPKVFCAAEFQIIYVDTLTKSRRTRLSTPSVWAVHSDFHPKKRKQRGENSHLCRNSATITKTQLSDHEHQQ